jgi:hypothetical protein
MFKLSVNCRAQAQKRIAETWCGEGRIALMGLPFVWVVLFEFSFFKFDQGGDRE